IPDEEERARVMVDANVRLAFEYAIFRPSSASQQQATRVGMSMDIRGSG
ncbi:hypothetical protein A2U01_0080309, partial [Trifolium medium]|nr:hypothetical protein [Trifolium medium]